MDQKKRKLEHGVLTVIAMETTGLLMTRPQLQDFVNMSEHYITSMAKQ